MDLKFDIIQLCNDLAGLVDHNSYDRFFVVFCGALFSSDKFDIHISLDATYDNVNLQIVFYIYHLYTLNSFYISHP